jgi:NodT family efflux transporter outer membrane factor (OMF) lipoprotein
LVNIMPRSRFRFALCVGLIAAGCVPSLNGNDPREPNKKAVPTEWGNYDNADGGVSPLAGGTSSGQQNYGQFFVSGELKNLIDLALKNNQELNIRLQEIIIAQNEVAARKGEYMPKVSAGAGVGLEKPGHTSQGVSDERHDLPDNLGNFQFGLMGTWEVDIWKKLRNAAKAANYRYLSSIEARNWTATQIIAELARTYYELIALDNQIDIVKRNIQIQTDALEVVKLEKLAARVTELAVQRFEAEVLKNRSRLFNLEQEKIQAENRINFLVGRFPQPVTRNSEEFKAPLPAGIQAGLPSALLENRPDVRQAELELEAAKLDVKVAKAAFYPSLSIDAGLGYRSFNATHLINTPESIAYDLGASLTAPLINRAAITADYRSANARQIQAVYNYERTILQAFTDVANQLAMIQNLQKSYELQQQQVDKLTNAVEVSNILFRGARADYMEVLLTRRDSLDAQLELVETKKRQFLSTVGIYQALGGGWRMSAPANGANPAPTAPPPAGTPGAIPNGGAPGPTGGTGPTGAGP